jgi:uncharacterized Tic20 family protein
MAENESSAPPPIQPLPPAAPPPPPVNPEGQARAWNMWCHLSVLSAFIIPFGNLLGPFLVWQIKKHEIPSVEAHAKAALNFQLTVLIALVVGAAIAFILAFVCVGYLLFPVVGVIALCGIIVPIIAGVRANDGLEYKYPYTIEFLK